MSTASRARGYQEQLMSAVTPEKRRVAVLLNDMNAAGGIQRVAANLVRDLQPWYRMTLLTVEPLRAPVFHDADLDFCSLNVKRNPRTRAALLRELFVAGRKLRG